MSQHLRVRVVSEIRMARKWKNLLEYMILHGADPQLPLPAPWRQKSSSLNGNHSNTWQLPHRHNWATWPYMVLGIHGTCARDFSLHEKSSSNHNNVSNPCMLLQASAQGNRISLTTCQPNARTWRSWHTHPCAPSRWASMHGHWQSFTHVHSTSQQPRLACRHDCPSHRCYTSAASG